MPLRKRSSRAAPKPEPGTETAAASLGPPVSSCPAYAICAALRRLCPTVLGEMVATLASFGIAVEQLHPESGERQALGGPAGQSQTGSLPVARQKRRGTLCTSHHPEVLPHLPQP